MEPNDLNSAPPDDEQLAAWYRANVANAPLPDNGFSRQVLAALPPPPQRQATRRRLFCIVGGLCGAAVTGVKISGTSPTMPDLSGLMPDVANALALPNAAVLALALGIAALSLCYALRPRFRF